MTVEERQFVEAWIAALRSEEYKQGKKCLNKEVDGICHFCCLGVACEVGITRGMNIKRQSIELGNTAYNGTSYFPPTEVMSIIERVPGLVIGDLVEMNDEGEKTFAEIANYIEKKLSEDKDNG